MTRMVSFLLIVIFAVNIADCTTNTSQDVVGVNHIPVMLQDYLQYAALNSAGLKAAFEQWKSEVEQVPQAPTSGPCHRWLRYAFDPDSESPLCRR